MILDVKYKDINQVLKGIRFQIIDSVQWCVDHLPVFKNPQQLFDYLKQYVTFKHDPENIELLQTAKTLFENNVHGRAGYGDCDCFVILYTSACIAQGWSHIDIVLAGRTTSAPVHIYNQIKFDGVTYIADLTQPTFDNERFYPLKQILKINFYS